MGWLSLRQPFRYKMQHVFVFVTICYNSLGRTIFAHCRQSTASWEMPTSTLETMSRPCRSVHSRFYFMNVPTFYFISIFSTISMTSHWREQWVTDWGRQRHLGIWETHSRYYFSLKDSLFTYSLTTLVLLELKSAEKLIKAKSYVYVHGTIYLSISQRRFT